MEQSIDDLKQLFEPSEQLIDELKQSFEQLLTGKELTEDLTQKAIKLFDIYGNDEIFGRSEIMELFNITTTPTGTVLSKLKSAGIIESVTGYGKGKYKFINF